jgi:transposase
VIGIDEISIGRGHSYRIVVSDLIRGRPIWFGGTDRSETSMDLFYEWLVPRKYRGIRLAVMDMWKPFRNSTLKEGNAPQAGILYDKFHLLKQLNEALDKVRKSEYARLSGKDRRFIKGQKRTKQPEVAVRRLSTYARPAEDLLNPQKPPGLPPHLTVLRTANRSFAEVARGLARRSSAEARTTPFAIEA